MDDYSDDGFDELNQDILQELENHAIVQFTQAQTQARTRAQAPAQEKTREITRAETQTKARQSNGSIPVPVQAQGPGSYEVIEIEDDDLDDSELINGLLPPASRAPGQSKPPVPPPPPPPAAPPAHPQRGQLNRPLAERATLAHHSSSQQQQQWNARPGLPPAPSYTHPPSSGRILPPGSTPSRPPPHRPPHGQFVRPPPTSTAHQASQGPPRNPSSSATASNDIFAALQQRVRVLEAELYTARGEIAIIRSNSTKAQQEHTAELGRVQKQNAEQQAKNQRLVEQALAAEKNATTELQFLQRDLQEASARARRKDPTAAAPKQTGATATGRAGIATTPGKTNKTWSVADGFDDMDMVVSPTKGRARTRDAGAVAIPPAERTPSKGKRKRPTLESPVMALETHEADVPMAEDGEAAAPSPVSYAAAPNALPFEFLPLVLDHASLHGEPPTFEILTRYSYPSDPTTSFAAIILRRLPLLGNPGDPYSLLIDFAGLIVDMWHQCLEEKLYRPIWDLASLVAFTLQLQTVSVAPYLINNIVPAIEKSIYKVAEIRFNRFKRISSAVAGDAASEELEQQIDTTFLLSLLRLIGMASVTSVTQTDEGTQTRQAEFWRMVPLDLVLIFLTPGQRLDDVLGMMDLLCTSALPKSIGPVSEERDAESTARMVLEKLTCNLVDPPREASTPPQVHIVGLAALRTLTAFAQSTFGALQIAHHVNAIPRMVAMLAGLVDELYGVSEPVAVIGVGDSAQAKKMAPGHLTDESDGTGDDLEGIHKLIKQTVRLLHRLVTDPETTDAANIQSKLAMAYGGSHRYILALSRIHFAEEDLVYEAGIDEETADLARELCEFVVTPDEGEGVREAFGV
ncbi:hypothetical protein ACRALDRAFT_2112952 [Sodiomyces alcalophilus JCM 7366]|uniref:uncharacterized protein n=1 Tax=Sodiomyces alcalophilus JCM 7366 TaxID=591952 RepID=UPI0039B49F9B